MLALWSRHKLLKRFSQSLRDFQGITEAQLTTPPSSIFEAFIWNACKMRDFLECHRALVHRRFEGAKELLCVHGGAIFGDIRPAGAPLRFDDHRQIIVKPLGISQVEPIERAPVPVAKLNRRMDRRKVQSVFMVTVRLRCDVCVFRKLSLPEFASLKFGGRNSQCG